jgi:hypothetical protein
LPDLANPKASAALKRRARSMLDFPVTAMPYAVQAIRFGKDLTLLAHPGEVVVDYGLRAKREYRSRFEGKMRMTIASRTLCWPV